MAEKCDAIGCDERFDDLNSKEYLVHSSYHDYHQKIRVAGQEELQHLESKLNMQIKCPLEDRLEGLYYFPQLPTRLICEWDQCYKEFYSAGDFYDHVSNHSHRVLDKCYWRGCKKEFKNITLSILREHLRVHTLQKLFACPKCGNFFSTKIKFDDHFLRHLKLSDLLRGRNTVPETIAQRNQEIPFNIEEYNVGSPMGNVKVFRCTFERCDKTFLTSSLLREHIRVHSNRFQCDQCQYSAKSGSQLESHKLYRHKDERSFKCRLCPKAFKQRGDLRAHIRRHQIKPYHCEECEFATSSEEGFSKHMKLHSNTHEYSCHLCGKLFSRGGNLSRHLKNTHKLFPSRGFCRFKFVLSKGGLYFADVAFESSATED